MQPYCLDREFAVWVCRRKSCISYPFLCQKKPCGNLKFHQNCPTVKWTELQQLLSAKKVQNPEFQVFFQQIHEAYQTALARIKDSYNDFMDWIQHLGLNKHESELYDIIKEKRFGDLRGEFIEKVYSELIQPQIQYKAAFNDPGRESLNIKKATTLLVSKMEISYQNYLIVKQKATSKKQFRQEKPNEALLKILQKKTKTIISDKNRKNSSYANRKDSLIKQPILTRTQSQDHLYQLSLHYSNSNFRFQKYYIENKKVIDLIQKQHHIRIQNSFDLLNAYRQVTELDFNNEDIDDQDMNFISNFVKLTKLELFRNNISIIGTIDLGNRVLKLNILDLNDNNITDEGLKNLCKLNNLEQLFLRQNLITDAGGISFKNNFSGLVWLNLSKNEVSNTTAEAISSNLNKLTHLYLNENNIGNSGALYICDKLHNLNILQIQNNVITESMKRTMTLKLKIKQLIL